MKRLSCGIVGLPNVGKSTLFSALTRKAAESANYPFCTIDPNIGIVDLEDSRLSSLAQLSSSRAVIPATVTFVDIAGLVKGASIGEGLGNQFLTHIRETDLIVQVVRCFEEDNIIHVSGKVDPIDDIGVINLELILSDLQMAENIAQKLEKQLKSKKEVEPLLSTLQKALQHLNNNLPLRSMNLSSEEQARLAIYPFLTQKKLLYVANVAENALPSLHNPLVEKVQLHAEAEGSLVIPICARIEEEISQLSPEEGKQYLHSLGLEHSGLTRLIQSSFSSLDLITFFTTGEMETKAWPIRKGICAQEAAGAIHTDLQNGFIRAEIVSYPDMLTYRGRVGAREAGKARSEGKEYLVQDGDVILFYHH